MNMKPPPTKLGWIGGLCLLVIALAGCSGQDTRPDDMLAACPVPEHQDLERAVQTVQEALSNGCEGRFDAYMERLLSIAKGNPAPENKERFSEFLVWCTEQGLLSRRQAQTLYNRYFNVKFVSMLGDYNTCALTCPRKNQLFAALEAELTDKELGLMKISGDRDAYYRADQLYQELELVLEATCAACTAEP